MSYEYKLTLTVPSTNEIVSLVGEFDQEDWERLENFTQYVDELLKTNLVQTGFPAKMKYTFSSETGSGGYTQLPPNDDIAVFLHRFRPIFLENESTNFNKICSVLGKELDHPHMRRMIKNQRDIYAGKRLNSMVQVTINDVLLTSEKVLSSWLNGYEYHRAKDARQFIEELHTFFPLDFTKVLFIQLLTEKTVAINNIAVLARVVTRQQEGFEGLVV